MSSASGSIIDPSMVGTSNSSTAKRIDIDETDLHPLPEEQIAHIGASLIENEAELTSLKPHDMLDLWIMEKKIIASDATKMSQISEVNQEESTQHGSPNTPDITFQDKDRVPPTPATPVPISSNTVSDWSSHVINADNNTKHSDQICPNPTVSMMETEPLSEKYPVESPTFDPQLLETSITEHRTTTVKKFHGIIQRLDSINAELQWIFSEYLTQQYEQLDETLASNQTIISQQKKNQGKQPFYYDLA
ncbi:hypothetical protein FBU30_007346 [Linnemannia zychae]|nr:hypothetical protein FBU30_007346 [Linnemannia zychae]